MHMLTIGHSNRPATDFIAALSAHGVNLLVDVRRIPRSRFNPQFNIENLPPVLLEAGVAYLHMPRLGGLRRPRQDSCNTGWRNPSFRGYADYMETSEFVAGLQELLRAASCRRCVIMCAEALPWRCHRSLIADVLLVRGETVEHIMSEGKRSPHALTKFARVVGTSVTYPAETLSLFEA
jgi:uncharacterized protein (DUF488 family)